MIEIKNLNKIYLKGKKNMVHALNNINLKIDDRETVAIIGENVMTPLYFNKKIKDKKGSVMRALKKTGIASLKAKKVSQLSGGQKQRVAISRALVTNPEYIFADEPTGSLDSKTSEEIVKMLFDLNRNGITIVIVTHNLEIANQCHHIIEIKDGNIIKDICS